MLRASGHTEVSLAQMAAKGFELYEQMLDSDYAEVRDNRYLKFHLFFCHWVASWRELGHPENYDSVWVEFSHKAVKDAADCASNNERDSQIASMLDRRFVAYVFTFTPIHI